MMEKVRTHGQSYSPEYRVWASLKNRCLSENAQAYEHYGARGIRVCHRWQESFEAFIDDMGPRPSKEHSIDRMDNDKGYTCGKCTDCQNRGDTANCRWATMSEQQVNRRKVRRLTWDGKTLLLKEWSAITGLSLNTLDKRLRHGWSVEDALTTPRRKYPDRS